MRVMIVGSGAREHALAWRIRRGGGVSDLFCLPGNGGTASLASSVDVAAGDVEAVVAAAQEHRIDLVVVGPEAPLVGGLVDRLRQAGVSAFGPVAAAARLEGSKVYAKKFMERHGIPTAGFRVFDDAPEAAEHVRARAEPMVVKADGLAAGKGVYVCATRAEALRAIDDVMVRRVHGDAGRIVIVEDCLAGEEASLLVITDGRIAVPLEAAQDHKRVGDGDAGENTGGMGACAPAAVLGPALRDRVMDRVVLPAIAGMRAEGTPFTGCLYAGLMIAGGEPQVLEFNVRFGDPETQPLMHLMDDDILPFLDGAAGGRLDDRAPRWHPGAACCVVMAQEGYPGPYRKGDVITGVEDAERLEGVVVFHAGTRRDPDGRLVASGGRVLGVSGLGADLAEARRRAYAGVDRIRWSGAFCRRDIGSRGSADVGAAGRG